MSGQQSVDTYLAEQAEGQRRDLDAWAHPGRHAMTVVTEKDSGGDVNLVAVCACGWRAIPVMWLHQANREHCPVLEALQERAARMRAHVDYLEWRTKP